MMRVYAIHEKLFLITRVKRVGKGGGRGTKASIGIGSGLKIVEIYLTPFIFNLIFQCVANVFK